MGVKFEQIFPSEFPRIASILEKYLPDSNLVYNILCFYMKFGEMKIAAPIVLYEGKSNDHFFYLVKNIFSQTNYDCFIIFWDPPSMPDDTLEEFFAHLPNWDPTKPYFIASGSESVTEKMELILQKEKYSLLDMEQFLDHSLCKFTIDLPEEEINIPKLPSGFVLKPLSPKMASFMLQLWDFNHLETLEGFQERLTKFPSYGIYKEKLEDDDTGEMPVSWLMMYSYGGFASLFTMDRYRRKGFGKILMLTASKELLKLGLKPYSLVVSDNSSSITFHKNIGFKLVGKVKMVMFTPKGFTI